MNGLLVSFRIRFSVDRLKISYQCCPNVAVKVRCNISNTLGVMADRRFIDLNLEFIRTHTFTPLWKELTDEFWQNDFRSIDGLYSLGLRVSLLCGALSRQLQGQKFFLLESVPDSGVCATYVSRESQRHRSVSASSSAKALSYGSSQLCFAQHLGQRQPGSRLENLRRLCS